MIVGTKYSNTRSLPRSLRFFQCITQICGWDQTQLEETSIKIHSHNESTERKKKELMCVVCVCQSANRIYNIEISNETTQCVKDRLSLWLKICAQSATEINRYIFIKQENENEKEREREINKWSIPLSTKT